MQDLEDLRVERSPRIPFFSPHPYPVGNGLSTQPGRLQLSLGSQAGPGSRVAAPATPALRSTSERTRRLAQVLCPGGRGDVPVRPTHGPRCPEPARPLTWLRPAAGGQQRGAQHRPCQQQRGQRRARAHAACRLPRGAALLCPRCRAALLSPAPARARPARHRPLQCRHRRCPARKGGASPPQTPPTAFLSPAPLSGKVCLASAVPGTMDSGLAVLLHGVSGLWGETSRKVALLPHSFTLTNFPNNILNSCVLASQRAFGCFRPLPTF